ncbi:hypothetical protein ZIOFF_051209 [Zingiber officinale]|uniref:ATP-dependent Clp protease proteolytic subunit n=1 Tax=Zingiber officinale TaxID=94328 RepID=A0A8J5FLJ3_ZINOF|nr:hypothetical protein ZIOFF_051209 [Zingiber officinale]
MVSETEMVSEDEISFETEMTSKIEMTFEAEMSFEIEITSEIEMTSMIELSFEIEIAFETGISYETEMSSETEITSETEMSSETEIASEIEMSSKAEMASEIKMSSETEISSKIKKISKVEITEMRHALASSSSIDLHLPVSSALQTPASAMRGAESDVIGLLLRERIVFLGTSVDDFVADAIISQLLLLDAMDPTKDIRLFVNSSGGSLSATMAIYDVVQLVRADVSTVTLGISASTTSIILGGGTKRKRFAMPNTRIMIHQPLGGASGKSIEV